MKQSTFVKDRKDIKEMQNKSTSQKPSAAIVTPNQHMPKATFTRPKMSLSM
jgi:hypothetical protein